MCLSADIIRVLCQTGAEINVLLVSDRCCMVDWVCKKHGPRAHSERKNGMMLTHACMYLTLKGDFMKKLTQLSVAVSTVLFMATSAFAQQAPQPQPGPGCDPAAVQCDMAKKPLAKKPMKKMKKVKKPMRAHAPRKPAPAPAPAPVPAKPVAPPAP